MITLVPLGGLCNRLRVLLSAIETAPMAQGGIRVLWHADADCGARFDELFQPLDVAGLTITERPLWATPARLRNALWPRFVRALMGYTLQREGWRPQCLCKREERESGACGALALPSAARQARSECTDDLRALAALPRHIFISSGYQLCPYGAQALAQLRPVPLIEQAIGNLRGQFAPHTIGVHIRRTDNARAIEGSPLEAFVRAMHDEVARDPAAHFYLATDDSEVKRYLNGLFSGRIITQSTQGSRADLQGLREAVTDLYCLAATHHILGSFWSSFSDTAAELGGIPLTIIRG